MLANIYGYQFNPCYEDVCFRFFSARTTSKVSFTLSREQRKAVFSFRAHEEKLQLPKIHLVINNRVSEYQLRFLFYGTRDKERERLKRLTLTLRYLVGLGRLCTL